MKTQFYLFTLVTLIVITSCDSAIKNKEAIIQDEVVPSTYDTLISKQSIPTDVSIDTIYTHNSNSNLIIVTKQDIIGYWVGEFAPAKDEDKNNVYAGDVFRWLRENKINISVDDIIDAKVKGHSIVAGNLTPFEGTVSENEKEFVFEVSEPGTNKYDGKFSFSIQKNGSSLIGEWTAFNKIEIPNRKYNLVKKEFKYDSSQVLVYTNKRYGDWTKVVKTKITDPEEKEVFGDYYEKFSSASELIYEINASSTLLAKKDVENLKKGDLLIIRNAIYARHGYSFKNRALRVFFDAQPWYIPVSTNIKDELTYIEKENIKLLLKYEKNAKEYYDSFGRG